MRVLHISSPKTWRGGEQQLIYLVEELNKLGVKQVIMCPFNSAVHKYCLKNHLNHVTYFKGFSANPMVAYRVNHVCKREKIELIHVHDSHAHNFAILSAVLTKNSLPLIVSRRVDFPVQGTSMSLFKYNHPQIKKIICVSEAIKDVMSKSIEDIDKLTVVHSGIDISKHDQVEKSNVLRKEFNVGDDELIIGNISALAPHKDYPTFIRVAKELLKRGVKAKFFAIGEGPSRKEVERTIEEEEMDDHIILTGFRTDISTVMKELDLFLMTSKTEGLGTTLLDALACEIPIVATAAGGVGEVIKNEETGLLPPVGDIKAIADAVERMLNDAALRKKVIFGGTESLKNFDKAKTAGKTKAIYEAVLSSM